MTDYKKLNPEQMESLSEVYEDVLEVKIKALYSQMIRFIAVSQLPLVHVNAVLDLIKSELIVQLRDGYSEAPRQRVETKE